MNMHIVKVLAAHVLANPEASLLKMASASGEPRTSAAEELQRLCHASGSFSKSDMRAAGRLCESGKEVLRNAAFEFLRDASGAAVLNSKSADGTPISVVVRSRRALPSGDVVARSGRQSSEFLIKNQFLRAFVPGQGCTTRVLLQEPVPLTHGKTALAIFSACGKDWMTLRQMGHTGCAIEHYCYDRFGISAHERLWRQWHAMSAETMGPAGPHVSLEALRLSEFVVVTACAAHDAQSAFRWGLQAWLGDKDLLRDAYVSIESLRNSMDLIIGHIGEWVSLRFSFVPDISPEAVSLRMSLWQALDVEAETAEMLAETLQLSFRGGRLQIAASAAQRPDLVDIVTTALLSTWKFVRWTESRFLTVGKASRTMIAAMLTGLEDLVQFIREDAQASKFFISGFGRLQGPVKVFLAEAALSSRVADGVLAELMEDGRVAMRYEALYETLAEEMKWLVDVPVYVWQEVGRVAGVPWEDLRSSCISAGHTSFHFFWRRVLRPAGDLPWRLARGDVRQNLLDMRDEEPPDEPFSWQMWQLLRMGVNIEQLVSTVRLLLEIGWTTLPAEQQHGSLASIRRWHPEYSMETLVGRAFLMQLRRLLPSMSEDEKALARLSKQLDRVLAKNPSAAGGRQEYVAELFAHLRERCWTHTTRDVPQHVQNVIFKRHGKHWAQFSVAARRDYELRARQRATAAQRELVEEADRIRAQRDLLLQRMDEESGTKPILVSECALQERHLNAWDDLLASNSFGPKRLETLRERALETPPPPSDSVQQSLAAREVWSASPEQMPSWAKPIIANRAFFKDAALILQVTAWEQEYWKIVYAVQQPYYLAVSKLELLPAVAPAEAVRVPGPAGPRDKYRFHCNFAANRSAAEVSEVEEYQVFVVLGLRHMGGMLVTSPCDAMPLSTYLGQLPAPAPEAQRATKQQKTTTQKDELVKAFPWLATLDEKEGFSSTSASASKGSTAAKDQGLDEDDLDQVMRELEQVRTAVAADAPERCTDDFRVTVLGGAWLLEHRGIPFDAVQGAARGAMAKDFCRRRQAQVTMRFDLGAYGQDACGVLARAWCHRMQHHFNLELESPLGANVRFDAALGSGYQEPTEFTRLAESRPSDRALQKRVAQIRAVFRAD